MTRFSPATQAWFDASFSAPTAAQDGAWDAIAAGRNALVVAPTGSGKTLAAFLWSIDRLASEPRPADARRRCRVLYVSPMKALAVDVERNLRAPLTGVRHAATRLGLPEPDLTVAVRSGDTPADERRRFTRTPPDILITTPESLFLLLTSQARDSLRGVETVIVDEVHAVAGTKRGAHLALSLERLDHLLDEPAQRIGLSATVRPVEEVARFLGGAHEVDVVQPPASKQVELEVVVPVEDLGELGQATGEVSGSAAGEERRTSIWPHVEERIVDLVSAHRSTIVFANSRRLAERLCARLNEIHYERVTGEALPEPGTLRPAQVMAQAGSSAGRPEDGAVPEIARAHHGSVSKEQRALIEEALKAGRLPAVVATSSLELGIDMGAVDLVIQVESPPSVASGLQRVGRAGHQVGAVSRGVIFPKYRGDLVQTAVVAERMRDGAIESLRYPRNPLDVLAQQIVAMVAVDEWDVEVMYDVLRRAAPYAALPRSAFESVLDMLAGRYPSDEFAELRPRLVWDRVGGTLNGRPGAQRLAVTSGGTIPDRGLFGVFLVGEKQSRRRGAGRGDGLRVAGRRRVHPRVDVVADRGHHARPGSGDPRSRAARPAAVLEGRHDGPSGRAGPGAGSLHPRARRALARGRPGPRPGQRARRVGGRQPARLPRRAARGDRAPARRPHDRRRAVPRRARRLAGGDPLPVRGPGPRAVGADRVGPPARALRLRRAGDALRRRHRAPAARHGVRNRGRGRRGGAVARRRRCRRRPRRGGAAGDRRGRGVGAVRVPVPRVRGPRPAAATTEPWPAYPSLAATPALGPAALGRQRLRLVPGAARDDARVPAGRVRRPRPGRADATGRGPHGALRGGRDGAAVAVRPVAALRLRRAVPVRR